jgi:uncharacterized protein (AIM24 family)
VRYSIQGELVPVLRAWLDGSVPLIFEHHVVLWKDPSLAIGIHPLKGAFKRMVADMPIFLTEARGPGEVAFSRDGAGHAFPLHLRPGTAVQVREHQYLAATGTPRIRIRAPARGGQHVVRRDRVFRRPLRRHPHRRARCGCTDSGTSSRITSRPAR